MNYAYISLQNIVILIVNRTIASMFKLMDCGFNLQIRFRIEISQVPSS